MNNIKKYAINKITISTMGLILLFLFYIIPSPNIFKEEIIINNNKNVSSVYLLDEDNYVSCISFNTSKEKEIDILKEKLDILINGKENIYNFYSLIPKDTKLNNIKIENDNIYLDFSKELLEVNKYFEDDMISAIVYSVTENNNISNVYITVDNTPLKTLPSNKKINYPLNRSFGINKEYNINNLSNITQTTIFFIKKYDDNEYYVPISKITNDSSNKIEIIIDELKSGINAQDNLNSYINDNLEVVDYDISDNQMNIIFNDYIFNDSTKKVILEEVKNVISKSIFENYDINEINIKTNKNVNISKIKKNT